MIKISTWVMLILLNLFLVPISSTIILMKKSKFFTDSKYVFTRILKCYFVSIASVFFSSVFSALLFLFLFDIDIEDLLVLYLVLSITISFVLPYILIRIVNLVEKNIIEKNNQKASFDNEKISEQSVLEEKNKNYNEFDSFADKNIIDVKNEQKTENYSDETKLDEQNKNLVLPKKKNKKTIFMCIFVGFIITIAYTMVAIINWSKCIFNVTIAEVIVTLTSPVKGASAGVVWDILAYCIPRVIVVNAIYLALMFYCLKIKDKNITILVKAKKKLKFKFNKIFNIVISLICATSLILSFLYVDNEWEIIAYLHSSAQTTTIYEDYFVNPKDADIQFTGSKKKNLIHIYMESMETTYASKDVGGAQNTNYLPNLVELANNNISFSNSSGFGGFNAVNGTTNTLMALFGQTSGVPYSFPILNNSMYNRDYFATGLTTIGDILNKFGYNQKFVCGSDAEFAGRDKFFKQHGNYEIVDYKVAKQKGYIPNDYQVWWGYEDQKLYEIAKKELMEIASRNEPFNFTMLTVDTHNVGGYHCSLCNNFNYSTNTANVVSCADMQVYNFIEWCKTQDFFEDSIIVITGDHLRMDTCLVDNIGDYNRMVYNCFINCEKSDDLKLTNRCVTSLDIFPTTLFALGFSWNGNRLGLGTNLFSNEQTLAEELGFGYFNGELSKKSKFYINTFS